MCTSTSAKKAQNVWNGWLDERDLAPGEVITNWFKRHTQRGLTLAAEYAKAGYEAAVERADVAFAGRTLLDSGTPAQEAIALKQQCDRAVAADVALQQMLADLSTQYREEARFSRSVENGQAIGTWAVRYGEAAEMLGKPPAEPQRSPVEQDAITLLLLRQAKTDVANKLLGVPVKLPENTLPASLPASSRSEAASAAARERVQTLLQQLFELHDLKSNGVLEEDELIKMNEKVSLLHYGKKDTNKEAIREKYRGVFREHLDPQGKPVPFSAFRDYMQGVLNDIDPDPECQVMMVEQFIAEAESARQAFRYPSLISESDQFFFPAAPAKAQGLAPAGQGAARPTPADLVAYEAAKQAASKPGTSDLPRGYQPDSTPTTSAGDSSQHAEGSRRRDGNPVVSRPVSEETAQAVTSSSSKSSAVPLPFQKGDQLQVWSNSKNSWRDGQVLEAFPAACEAEGFAVPAGTVKVSFDAGTVKWVMPAQAASLLRPRPKS
ncbi:unnamed protein product [Symbiodinium natans]|uniref:EF-hand domain-containing protein n=1 Tax=Symbiodinium natans TaxID=878477 RepID=A0A812QEN7_9DINO|nr:unnamed protein product [Symbiodinium natans]